MIRNDTSRLQASCAATPQAQSAFSRISQFIWPAVAIVAVGAFLLLNLRAGQVWDGDFALYLMNSKNILHGLDYAKTAYLFNPQNAIEPAAYPPGLPLLLVPVVHYFGIDLAAVKIECVLALLGFLALYWLLASDLIGSRAAAILLVAFGLHPFIVSRSNTPASEFPFLLFCYAALLLFDRLQSGRRGSVPALWSCIFLAGAATAMAYLTRSVGMLLFPAALVASAYRDRRPFSPTTLAVGAAGLLCVLVQLKFPGDVGTYVHYFDNFSVWDLLSNARRYGDVAVTMLGDSRAPVLWCLALLGVAGFGFVARLRRISIFECFFASYVGLLVIYPIALEMRRYEMPIWPLLFLYCASGLSLLTAPLSVPARRAIAASVVIITSLFYAREYRRLDFRPIPYSVTDPRSEQLFAAIRQLPPGSRVLFRKPAIVALYTGHETSIWPEQFTDPELHQYLRRSKTDYVVEDHPPMGVNSRHPDPLHPFIERNRSLLHPIFENEWFSLYRVQPSSTAATLTTAPEG